MANRTGASSATLNGKKYFNVTAGTGQVVKSGVGELHNVIVNSHTSGTLKFWDGVVGTGDQVMINTITLATGSQALNLGGITFGTGCVIDVGGTADVTVVYL